MESSKLRGMQSTQLSTALEQPSPLSFVFNLDDEYNYNKHRSCLPGSPNQRCSVATLIAAPSNKSKTNRTQKPSSSTSTALLSARSKRSPVATMNRYHHSMGALLPDEMAMIDHMSIVPSPSLPNTRSYHDSRDLYHSSRGRRQSDHVASSRLAGPQLRRPRNATSSISRSATAALATPSSSSSSQKDRRGHHHYSNTTSSGYNNYRGAGPNVSPSKRSSSLQSTRVSISSQISSATPSNYEDDNGTVSTRRSENSVNRYYNGRNPPSPMQLLNTASRTTSTQIQQHHISRSTTNNSVSSSTATKSSSGTNTMGNTSSNKQRTVYNTRGSPVCAPSHNNNRATKTTNTTTNSIPSSPSKTTIDVDTLQRHLYESRIIVDDLHRSIGTSVDQRHKALSNACLLFDHTIEPLHNIELAAGALAVIATLLFIHEDHYLLHDIHKTGDDFLHLILSGMEMVSRGSPSVMYNTVNKIKHLHENSNEEGGLHVVKCLLRLLNRFESNIMPNGIGDKRNHPGSIRHDISEEDSSSVSGRNVECIVCIGKTIISLSRSSEFRSIFIQRNLFQELTQTLFSEGNANDIVNNKTMIECRLCRLQISSNLIKNSGNEHRELIYQFDGFLDNILRYCNFDPVVAIRQASSSCIVEMTNTPSICSEMAKSSKVIGTMVRMILLPADDGTLLSPNTSSALASTTESALTALQNIAFDRLNRPPLINFKNGIVLEALKKTLSSNSDSKIRRRAAGTVVNLIGEETAEFIVTYNGLLDVLVSVATQDDNIDVQIRAALSLTKLGAHIADLQIQFTELSSNYLTILDALVVSSLNKTHCSRVTAVIRSIARKHTAHRPILARHEGIVDTLTDVILARSTMHENTNQETRDGIGSGRINAIHALAHLAHSDDATRKSLCSRPTLLAAVVAAAQTKDTQGMAILVLERLATVTSNRNILAHCSGLIIAVAEAVERESRLEKQQQKAIQNGQQFVENRCDNEDGCSTDGKATLQGSSCYLAKPLLMSLLLSM